jgi:hypothetical protein
MPRPFSTQSLARRFVPFSAREQHLSPHPRSGGGPGAPFDVPLNHKDAAKVRSHFDGMEVLVPDAPRDNEIAVAIAVTDGGRPHPRVGGLQLNEIKGEDGLV